MSKNSSNSSLVFDSIISYVAENEGIFLPNNLEKLSKFIPYCFKGKILHKENNEILFAIPEIDKIIILSGLTDKFKSIEENQYIFINFVIFNLIDEKNNIIYFKINYFTEIKVINDSIIKEDDKRVYL